MRRYRDTTPRIITAKFASTGRCGHRIACGDSILYYPSTKSAYCPSCSQDHQRELDARRFDEMVADSGHSPW